MFFFSVHCTMSIANVTNMYNEPLDGSWCLTCDHMRQTYFGQIRSPSNVAKLFWTDSNLQFVRSEVERLLTRESQMDVSITSDAGFYNVCENLCNFTTNLFDVQRGLDALNKAVINDLVYVHLSSIKRRKIFMKQAIYGDRDLYLPPPELTHGRKRIIKPSTEAYMVQHNPNSRYNEEFQTRLKNTRKYSQFPLFDLLTQKS